MKATFRRDGDNMILQKKPGVTSLVLPIQEIGTSAHLSFCGWMNRSIQVRYNKRRYKFTFSEEDRKSLMDMLIDTQDRVFDVKRFKRSFIVHTMELWHMKLQKETIVLYEHGKEISPISVSPSQFATSEWAEPLFSRKKHLVLPDVGTFEIVDQRLLFLISSWEWCRNIEARKK